MADSVCSGFEPQNYLKDRCKKCFRLKTKHDDTQSSNIIPNKRFINNNTLSTTFTTTSSSALKNKLAQSTPTSSSVNIRTNSKKNNVKTALNGHISINETNVINNNVEIQENSSNLTKTERRKSWRDKTLTPNTVINNNNNECGPDFEGILLKNNKF